MPGPGPGRKGCASCRPLAQDGSLQQPAALSSPPTGPSKPSTGSRPYPEMAHVHTRAQARVTKRGLRPDRHGLGTSDNKESLNSWGAGGRHGSCGPHPGRSTPTSQTLGPPIPKHRARRQPASTRYRRHGPRGRLRAHEGSGRAQGTLMGWGWGGRCRAQTTSLSSCLRGRGRHWQLAPSPPHAQGPPHTPTPGCPRVQAGPEQGLPLPPPQPSQRKPKYGSKRAPAHRTEPNLQQSQAAWPRGCRRRSGNTRALASPNQLHAAARMHCRRGAETRKPPPEHAASPRPRPPQSASPPQHLREPARSGRKGRETTPKTQCPGSGAPCPVPSRPWPARGAKSHEGHAPARHIPPRPPCPPPPLLPTRAENTSSGSDLEPRWLRPKCR